MKKLLLFLMVLCAVFPVFSQQRIDQVFDFSLTTQTGTLMVYDANNSDGKVYSASNKDFNQISKMVFTPNDPDIDDQIIITVDANGTTNADICRSNSLWMYIHNRVKLTFTTKNQRGKIKAIDFSIANAQFASRVQYFILDDSNTFYPTYDGKKTFNASKGTWNYTLNEGNDQHTVIIANSSSTTACGFEKIKITWTPGTAEPPAIPNAEISEATEDDEGTYHFLSTASAKITGPDDADIYYTFTTDESVVEPTISDENKIASGESVTITETGRLLIQSVNKNNPNLKSAVNTYDFKKTDVVTVANIGELTKNGIHDGLGVIINCRLNTLGTYETNAENFTGRPTYYAYVRDINNNVIKLVSQGTPFPESYSAIGYHNSWGHDGLYIEPMGVAGEFRYNNGLPEIYVKSVTSDFTSYLKDATNKKGPSETWKPMSIRTDKITQDMFNRRVVLQNMKWIGENSQIEDAAGNRFQVYSRLIVPVYEYGGAATTTTKSFQQLLNNPQAGHHYQIEAFIGQNRGELLVFPIVELRETPNAPKVMAPNALDGEVNIISDEIKIWVDEATAKPGATYTYHTYINSSDENYINTPVGIGRENAVTLAMDKLFGAANEIKMEISGSLSYQACHGSNDVYVFGDTTTLTLRRHKADVESSIAAFKTKYLESTDLPTLGSDNFAATHYSKLDDTEGAEAKALVIETTPNWLYVRDLTAGADAASNNFLMLNNTNGWESPRIPDATAEGGERALRPGDIITGFAMIPARTSLGNLVSANTGFARTVKYLETSSEKTDSTIIRINYENPADAEHYFKNIAFDEDNRMMMFTLKNVKVDVKNISGSDEYILRIGDTDAPDHKPVSLNLSIFEHRVGGWRLAYKEDAEYDITGVLVKNDEIGGYSLALINFYGTGLTETPEVFVADSEDKSAEVQNFTHTLTFEMTAGTNAEIWYTTDGTDPRNNVDSRQHYTGPVKLDLAEGQDRVVVKAFAVEAGMTPSATVTRTFVKNSRELSLLLNFINRAEEGTDYHFNGTVRVVDKVGDYMFVRGVAGHYMPIYLEGGWESNALSAGDYLTDFLINPLFAGEDENKVLRAAEVTPGFESKFDTPLTGSNLPDIDISNTPEVTEVGANNIRRKVSLTNVMFAHPAGNDAAWLMLAHSGEATPVAVNAEATGIDMSEVRANTNYAVTGYVMVAENSDAIEFWPMNLTVIPTPAPVKAEVNALAVKENGNEYTASFYPTASVAFTHEDPRATIQYFIGDKETDENTRWYEYYAGHPLVITESCHIHVRALNAQGKTSAETHVNLTLLTPAGDVVFAQVDDEKEGTSTVTLAAKDGSDAEIWYSVGTPDNMEKYDNPFTLDKTAIVYARIRGGENAADGALCHSLIIVPVKPEAPKDIETNGNSLRFSQSLTEEGWAVVTIEPVTPVEGGTIYYTTEAGKKLPGEGIKYEAPVVMKESGVIIAIMTIEGQPASQAYETTVWVVPVTTGIDGIESDNENAVRVDGDSIIAPEGSEVYDLNGRRVNPTGLAAGVYIVRTPDGKAVKVRI